MTYDQLLDHIISDGIAEVRQAYADPKDHHKRDGAIEGFEACRGKTPDQIVVLWQETNRASLGMMGADSDIEEYWKLRYHSMQLEWTLNVLSVALSRPLLGHLPTYRGAMKFHQIIAGDPLEKEIA